MWTKNELESQEQSEASFLKQGFLSKMNLCLEAKFAKTFLITACVDGVTYDSSRSLVATCFSLFDTTFAKNTREIQAYTK